MWSLTLEEYSTVGMTNDIITHIFVHMTSEWYLKYLVASVLFRV